MAHVGEVRRKEDNYMAGVIVIYAGKNGSPSPNTESDRLAYFAALAKSLELGRGVLFCNHCSERIEKFSVPPSDRCFFFHDLKRDFETARRFDRGGRSSAHRIRPPVAEWLPSMGISMPRKPSG